MVLDYFTNLTRTFPFEEVRPGMMGPALVRKEPVGVVAGIIPWNVPLFITMLKFAPTLASGSTMVLKPAPETPLDAFLLAELVEQAGIPAGVLNVVPAGREVGEYLVTHDGVDKVSFTGSTAAGRRIGSLCGERLRRCTLELGGKSAAILMDDIDVADGHARPAAHGLAHEQRPGLRGPDPHPGAAGRATTRSSTPSRRPSPA